MKLKRLCKYHQYVNKKWTQYKKTKKKCMSKRNGERKILSDKQTRLSTSETIIMNNYKDVWQSVIKENKLKAEWLKKQEARFPEFSGQ